MSLIIKDVGMPKSGKSITYSSKEIIEILRPHGRLIDADRLLKVLSKNSIISKITRELIMNEKDTHIIQTRI